MFVDETIRDAVQPLVAAAGKIPKGKYVEVEVPKEWCGIWDDSLFPDEGTATVYLREDISKVRPPEGAEVYEYDDGVKEFHRPIGTVSWKTRFSIEDFGNGKFVMAGPSKVKFTSMTELIDGTLVDDRLLG